MSKDPFLDLKPSRVIASLGSCSVLDRIIKERVRVVTKLHYPPYQVSAQTQFRGRLGCRGFLTKTSKGTCPSVWAAIRTPPDRGVRIDAELEPGSEARQALIRPRPARRHCRQPPGLSAKDQPRPHPTGGKNRPCASTARPRTGRGDPFVICVGVILLRAGGIPTVAPAVIVNLSI